MAKTYRSDVVSFPVPHLKGYKMLICLISGDVNHSYLVKVVPVGLLSFMDFGIHQQILPVAIIIVCVF